MFSDLYDNSTALFKMLPFFFFYLSWHKLDLIFWKDENLGWIYVYLFSQNISNPESLHFKFHITFLYFLICILNQTRISVKLGYSCSFYILLNAGFFTVLLPAISYSSVIDKISYAKKHQLFNHRNKEIIT